MGKTINTHKSCSRKTCMEESGWNIYA